ncbi:MAG: hypothetical protein ABSA54_19720 [Terriglobales bacterium]|jgi:GH24 family phage-related lysozyme (muramidase)
MTIIKQRILVATLVFAMVASGLQATGQSTQTQVTPALSAFLAPESLPLEDLNSALLTEGPEISYLSQPFFSHMDSDIKFRLETLMDILRDSKHESWVLAAYPDPKTSRPLIGAGFSLDVRETEHLQRDLLNPHTFIEPSSAELWQAAGLSSERLQIILEEFERDLNTWKKENFRRKIRTHQLSPQLTNEEATELLQISAVLAVHNARAYCRKFDQLTASQQMALSQLVYQMGVNLEEFAQFLTAINDPSYDDSAQLARNPESETEHWKTVQRTLINSDWARRYCTRAVAVIAMFDLDYDADPTKAERQVRAEIRPLVVHHRNKPHARFVRIGNKPSPVRKNG